jgi:iron complex transport system substrate-binding protein
MHRTLAFIVVLALSLGACSNTSTEETQPPQSDEITVVDALGRTVDFARPPQRIVIAGKAALIVADAVYLFPEAQERVVALVRAKQNVGDFLVFVDPTFDSKMLLDVEAGPEQIAPTNPDVVVLKSYMFEQLGQPLEQIGIQVVCVDLETPEQYFSDLTTLGQLFGDETRAEEIRSFYQSRLERVSQGLQELDQDQKPRVLVLQHSAQGGEVAFKVPAASWIQTTAVELAGGIPVWKEDVQGGGWIVVNFEQIAAWNPDMIFVIDYQSDSAQVVEELKSDPQWHMLQAVQDGQIYGFAADVFSWDQPDPRWILGLTWLAQKTHPDSFSDLDMMQEIHQFFEQLYGMEQAAITDHILPNLQGDVQ